MIDNLIFIQNELDKLEKEKINLQKKISFNFKINLYFSILKLYSVKLHFNYELWQNFLKIIW